MTIHFDRTRAAHPRASLLLSVAALAVFGACACATHPGVERLANGDLHVTCSGPLAQCLLPAADQCAAHGFDVLTASERRDTTGAPPEQQEIVRSEATVRCREAVPLFGRDPKRPAPAVNVVAAAASASGPPRCVPGQSQACALPSGCSGAQVCVADGSHFAPCECAPAAVAPSASVPSAQPDAGAP